MKTLKSLFTLSALVFALMFANTSNANPILASFGLGSTTVQISVAKEAKAFTLNLKDIRSENVVIRIIDVNGNVLIEEKVSNQKEYSKKFNLMNLPEGDYLVSISKSMMETIQPMKITYEGISADENSRTQKFKPAFVHNGNKLDINLLLPNSSAVKVTFVNEKGEEIFTDNNPSVQNFSKRFNLSQLEAGRYTVLVETRNDLFSQKLVIE